MRRRIATAIWLLAWVTGLVLLVQLYYQGV